MSGECGMRPRIVIPSARACAWPWLKYCYDTARPELGRYGWSEGREETGTPGDTRTPGHQLSVTQACSPHPLAPGWWHHAHSYSLYPIQYLTRINNYVSWQCYQPRIRGEMMSTVETIIYGFPLPRHTSYFLTATNVRQRAFKFHNFSPLAKCLI